MSRRGGCVEEGRTANDLALAAAKGLGSIRLSVSSWTTFGLDRHSGICHIFYSFPPFYHCSLPCKKDMARHFCFLRVCLGEARFETARLVGGCRLDQRWWERWNGHKDQGESIATRSSVFYRRTTHSKRTQQTPRHEHTPRHGKGMVQHSGRQGSGGAMVSLGLFFFFFVTVFLFFLVIIFG